MRALTCLQAAWLLGQLRQVASSSYKLSTCDIVHIEVDAEKNKRKVVQHADMVHDLCKKLEPEKKDSDMAADCQAFCSIGGEQLAFPVQMGTEFFGFDLPQMKEICTTIFEGDASSAKVCVDNSLANYQIQLATSYYLAAVERFEQEQLIFTADMDKQSKKLIASFKDPFFVDDLDEKVPSEKLEVVKAAIDDWIANTKRRTDGANDMQDAVDNLAEQGTKLVDVVTKQLPRFRKFVTDCNQDMLGFGQEEEVILDVCSQDSLACIEKEEAAHVGCCCGVNYVATAPKYMIDGINHPRLKGARSLKETDVNSSWPATRRAEAARLLTSAPDKFDVCANAKKINKKYMADSKDRLETSGAAVDVKKQAEAKKCKYKDYYTACPDRAKSRLLQETGDDERLLQEVGDDEMGDSTQSLEFTPAAGEHSETLVPEFLRGEERHLQEFSCFPPVVDTTGTPVDSCTGSDCLKVAFTKYTKERCDQLLDKFAEGEGMEASKVCKAVDKDFEEGAECKPSNVMEGMCKSFCEPIGIPINFGNEYFGFSLEKVSKICMGSIRYDKDLLDDCALNASAFSEVKFKTSAFIAQNQIFEAAKDNYIAAARDAVKVVSEHMLSEEVREKMLNSMDKPKTYKAELEKKRAEIESLPKRALLKEIKRLQEKADSLMKTLERDIPKLTWSLKQCNDLFLAEGTDRAYMLDNCWGAKAGPRCFEDKKSTHAGCCCAYNPVTQFGRSSSRNAPTIEGTSAIPGSTVGSRRLQKQGGVSSAAAAALMRPRRLSAKCDGSTEVIDICAEAWTQAAPEVQQYYKDATPSAKEVMEETEKKIKSKYPETCGMLKAKLETATAAPDSSGPAPSGPAPSGGSPTPSGGSPSPSPSGGSSPAPPASGDDDKKQAVADQASDQGLSVLLLALMMVISNAW